MILIVVVLATFGGIALTAGWTNKQLSIKAAQSKVDYYALDSEAEKILAEVDSLLYSSAVKTTGYLSAISTVEDMDFLKAEEKLQSLFVGNLDAMKSPALRTKKIYGVFNRLYFYECAKSLDQLAKDYGLEITYSNGYESAEDFLAANKLPKPGDISLSFSVSEGQDSGDKNLDVIIAVAAPLVEAQFEDDGTWYLDFTLTADDMTARYEIYSWRLRQNPIEEEIDTPKFG